MKNVLRIGGLGFALAISSLAAHALSQTCLTACSFMPRTQVVFPSSYNECCYQENTACPDGLPRYGSTWNPGTGGPSVRCPV
jgi:hypothetical protein